MCWECERDILYDYRGWVHETQDFGIEKKDYAIKKGQQNVSELKLEQTELQPSDLSDLGKVNTDLTNDTWGDTAVGFRFNINSSKNKQIQSHLKVKTNLQL